MESQSKRIAFVNETRYLDQNFNITDNGKSVCLVKKGTASPWQVEFLLKTTRDGQETICFEFSKGDSDDPQKNSRYLAKIDGIPKGEKGKTIRVKIEGDVIKYLVEKENRYIEMWFYDISGFDIATDTYLPLLEYKPVK